MKIGTSTHSDSNHLLACVEQQSVPPAGAAAQPEPTRKRKSARPLLPRTTPTTSESNARAALLPQHQALLDASAIDATIVTARGYRSVVSKAELKSLGFTQGQARVPALLIPIHGVHEEIVSYLCRPDAPRVSNGKATKYEIPKGSSMVLDVPPAARPHLGDPKVPLFVTEGARKSDAAVSLGLCCISLIGVWCWRGTNVHGGKVALADWESIALNDRDVYITFDSDMTSKPEVYGAVVRFREFLKSRHAHVRIIYLPPGDGGAKVGLDDFLAAGNGKDELLALASTELRPPPDDGRAEPPLYFRTRDGLFWNKTTNDGAVETQLTNFLAKITEDVLEDDGVAHRRAVTIKARLGGTRRTFTIPAMRFTAMDWCVEQLGAGAIVSPGFGLRDRARVAIQTLSGEISTRSVFTHTGWRLIDDRPRFLSAGGAIGADGFVDTVEVHLPPNLSRIALPLPLTGAACRDAVRASLALQNLAPDVVMLPLLGAIYVAPLRELLTPEPDFTLWVHGPSGQQKTELVALAQAHFGAFDRLTLPASFGDTPNAIERLLFTAKDTLLVVDDYHPAANPREAQNMEQVANRIVRGVGNAAGRNRMRADLSLHPEMPPRAFAIATGERLPSGHSNVARLFPVAVPPGAVNLARLTLAQRDRDLLAQSMAAYVQAIARDWERLMERLAKQFLRLRREASAIGAHARSAGQIAHLMIGIETFSKFAVAEGVLSREERAALLGQTWDALHEGATENQRQLVAEDPVARFLASLRDGFASRTAFLEQLPDGGPPPDANAWGWEMQGDDPRHAPHAAHLGWLGADHVFLNPTATHEYLVQSAKAAGREFPVDWGTMLRRLDEKGLIATQNDGHREIKVRFGDTTRRVVKLRRDAIEEGPGEDTP